MNQHSPHPCTVARRVKGSMLLTEEKRPGEEAEQGWLDSELLMESWWLSGGPGVCSAHMIFLKIFSVNLLSTLKTFGILLSWNSGFFFKL